MEGQKPVNRKTVAQEERSGTKASGTCTTRTVSVAPAPVVEYIAPATAVSMHGADATAPAVPLCCCMGQVKDEMKGGSFEVPVEVPTPRQQ